MWHGDLLKAGIDSDGTNIDVMGNLSVLGIPVVGTTFGNAYFVDYRNGADTNNGKTRDTALKTLSAAVSAVTTNNNDVIFIDGDSEVVETAMISLTKNRVHIVTDSSADLPDDVISNQNLTIVPHHIQFGKKLFLDGVDITPELFYTLMESEDIVPRTYPASDEEIHSVFSQLVDEQDIVSIFMSKRMDRANDMSGIFLAHQMSSTFGNATNVIHRNIDAYSNQRMASYRHDDLPEIEVIDSKLVSMGTGLLVMEAIEKIGLGWPAAQVRAYLDKLIPKVRVLFILNTPENLKQGWQVKEPKSVLRIKKPILSIQNGTGVLKLVEQAKDGKDPHLQLERLIREDLLGYRRAPRIKAAVMHSNDPMWAEEMSLIMMKRFDCGKPIRSRIGPVAGAHCGPGAGGVAYFPVIE